MKGFTIVRLKEIILRNSWLTIDALVVPSQALIKNSYGKFLSRLVKRGRCCAQPTLILHYVSL